MQPIFTIHAGEYLIASLIENRFKEYDVWVPSKDRGVDLLITNPANKKMMGLQVKFSKDWLATSRDWAGRIAEDLKGGLKSCGWWQFGRDKLRKSPADLWILVSYGLTSESIQYVVIKPKELLKRLINLRGNIETINTYLWTDSNNKCWETRALKKGDRLLIAKGKYSNPDRDFTRYLNDWNAMRKFLGS